MAKRKTKPVPEPDEATTGTVPPPMPPEPAPEADVFEESPVAGATDVPTEQAVERLIRGLGALHESFKQYKKQTDARLDELKGIIEGVGKRIRGG